MARYICDFFPDPFAPSKPAKPGQGGRQGRRFRPAKAQGKGMKFKNSGYYSIGRKSPGPCKQIEIFADDIETALSKANGIKARKGYGGCRVVLAANHIPMEPETDAAKTARLKALRLAAKTNPALARKLRQKAAEATRTRHQARLQSADNAEAPALTK